MKKGIVLDTNVLLYDTDCLGKFKDNNLFIPLVVIEELDALKDDYRKSELAHASREITNKLLNLAGEDNLDKLREGFQFLTNSQETAKLQIIDEHELYLEKVKLEENSSIKYRTPISNDDWIIFCAKILDATLVTRDNNMILKSSGYCKVEHYHADSIKQKEVYKGYRKITASSEFIDEFMHSGKIPNSKHYFENYTTKMYPNEFLIIQDEDMPSKQVFGICKGGFIKKINLDDLQLNGTVLRPKGLSQKLAMYLLTQPEIKAVSFLGGSGTGKTSISIDYALNAVDKQEFNQMYYAKSLKGLADDEDYGFVPGNVDEKMQEVVIPLICTLEVLENIRKNKNINYNKSSNKKITNVAYTEKTSSGEEVLEKYKENSIIRILPLNYLRGMTITNKILILDEGQNLTIPKIKTLTTRIDESSKFIITGDDNQIDDKNLNKFNNGLAHFIEKGKHEDFIAHLTLDLDSEGSKRGRLSNFGNTL